MAARGRAAVLGKLTAEHMVDALVTVLSRVLRRR
jgi:hypothetical protein